MGGYRLCFWSRAIIQFWEFGKLVSSELIETLNAVNADLLDLGQDSYDFSCKGYTERLDTVRAS